MVGKANNDEDNSEKRESHKLDRFFVYGINECDCDPVARDGTRTDNDQVADCSVVENLVHVGTFGVSDSLQNDGVIQAKTIKGHIQEEP